MAEKHYRVAEVARLAGITVRTLHHWDEIGLLLPSARSRAGHRLYDQDDLLRLQQICIGRGLGLSLEQIRRTLDDPTVDRRALLLEQRASLQRKVKDTQAMIAAIDAALKVLDGRGGKTMNPRELFDGFDPSAYEEEARQRWGHTEAYRESSRRAAQYTREDWQRVKAEVDEIMQRLAAAKAEGLAPDAAEVLGLAERHRLHIDRWFYPCSHDMHANLAAMYRADARFAAWFERYAEGLAEYVATAIEANRARGRESG